MEATVIEKYCNDFNDIFLTIKIQLRIEVFLQSHANAREQNPVIWQWNSDRFPTLPTSIFGCP
jgi:hypothetical protein